MNAADCFREPRSRLRRRVNARSRALADGHWRSEERYLPGGGRVSRLQLLAGRCTPKEDAVRAWGHVPYRQPGLSIKSGAVLDIARDLRDRRRRDVWRPTVDSAIMSRRWVFVIVLAALRANVNLAASGHGPVFGAATPTLGRGGWSLDQAYTFRGGDGDNPQAQQMFKTMVSFGITETVQVSGSVPVAMADGLGPSRMMSAMSSEREFEGLLAYRFQRRPIGIGGRQESTLYVGGTVPMEDERAELPVGPSLVIQAATGYASRAHYAWVGGGIQHFFEQAGARQGASRFLTFVYGYRPPPLRVEPGKPDLRFFVEATAEDRANSVVSGADVGRGGRSVFVGPTSLLVYKAIALEGGVLFPVYQRAAEHVERVRVAVNFAYFFWLD